MLSQLSYSPAVSDKNQGIPAERSQGAKDADLVGLERLELSTSPLSGVRSNHLPAGLFPP